MKIHDSAATNGVQWMSTFLFDAHKHAQLLIQPGFKYRQTCASFAFEHIFCIPVLLETFGMDYLMPILILFLVQIFEFFNFRFFWIVIDK